MVDLRHWGGLALTGLVNQFAPGIAAGALVQILKDNNVSVQGLSKWVQENHSLWDELSPEQQKDMRTLASKVNDISWMTADWAIEALKKDLPGLASLFMGWAPARHWLERQLEIIRREIKS